MVSFQRVLVFIGYSFRIQFLPVLAPASLEFYFPQPESQEVEGRDGSFSSLSVNVGGLCTWRDAMQILSYTLLFEGQM